MEDEIFWIKSGINKKGEEIKEIQKKIDLLSDLDPEQEIISVNIDNADSHGSTVKDIINNSSWITILEKNYG